MQKLPHEISNEPHPLAFAVSMYASGMDSSREDLDGRVIAHLSNSCLESGQSLNAVKLVRVGYDYSYCPKAPPKDKDQHDLSGILKVGWLTKHSTLLPSVVVMILNLNVMVTSNETVSTFIEYYHKIKTGVSSRDVKIVVLVVKPGNTTESTAEKEAFDDRINAMKKHMQVDARLFIIATLNDFPITEKVSGTNTSITSKKISKLIRELSHTYYNNNVKRLKMMAKLLPTGKGGAVLKARFHLKAAFYFEILGQFLSHALKYYRIAYDAIRSLVAEGQSCSVSLQQIKQVGEWVNFKICRILLRSTLVGVPGSTHVGHLGRDSPTTGFPSSPTITMAKTPVASPMLSQLTASTPPPSPASLINDACAQHRVHIATFSGTLVPLVPAWTHYEFLCDQYLLFVNLLELFAIPNNANNDTDRSNYYWQAYKNTKKRYNNFVSVVENENAPFHDAPDYVDALVRAGGVDGIPMSCRLYSDMTPFSEYSIIPPKFEGELGEIAGPNGVSDSSEENANRRKYYMIYQEQSVNHLECEILYLNSAMNLIPESRARFRGMIETHLADVYVQQGHDILTSMFCFDNCVKKGAFPTFSPLVNSASRDSLAYSDSPSVGNKSDSWKPFFDAALRIYSARIPQYATGSWNNILENILRKSLHCCFVLGNVSEYLQVAMKLYHILVKKLHSDTLKGILVPEKEKRRSNALDSQRPSGKALRFDLLVEPGEVALSQLHAEILEVLTRNVLPTTCTFSILTGDLFDNAVGRKVESDFSLDSLSVPLGKVDSQEFRGFVDAIRPCFAAPDGHTLSFTSDFNMFNCQLWFSDCIVDDKDGRQFSDGSRQVGLTQCVRVNMSITSLFADTVVANELYVHFSNGIVIQHFVNAKDLDNSHVPQGFCNLNRNESIGCYVANGDDALATAVSYCSKQNGKQNTITKSIPANLKFESNKPVFFSTLVYFAEDCLNVPGSNGQITYLQDVYACVDMIKMILHLPNGNEPINVNFPADEVDSGMQGAEFEISFEDSQLGSPNKSLIAGGIAQSGDQDSDDDDSNKSDEDDVRASFIDERKSFIAEQQQFHDSLLRGENSMSPIPEQQENFEIESTAIGLTPMNEFALNRQASEDIDSTVPFTLTSVLSPDAELTEGKSSDSMLEQPLESRDVEITNTRIDYEDGISDDEADIPVQESADMLESVGDTGILSQEPSLDAFVTNVSSMDISDKVEATESRVLSPANEAAELEPVQSIAQVSPVPMEANGLMTPVTPITRYSNPAPLTQYSMGTYMKKEHNSALRSYRRVIYDISCISRDFMRVKDDGVQASASKQHPVTLKDLCRFVDGPYCFGDYYFAMRNRGSPFLYKKNLNIPAYAVIEPPYKVPPLIHLLRLRATTKMIYPCAAGQRGLAYPIVQLVEGVIQRVNVTFHTGDDGVLQGKCYVTVSDANQASSFSGGACALRLWYPDFSSCSNIQRLSALMKDDDTIRDNKREVNELSDEVNFHPFKVNKNGQIAVPFCLPDLPANSVFTIPLYFKSEVDGGPYSVKMRLEYLPNERTTQFVSSESEFRVLVIQISSMTFQFTTNKEINSSIVNSSVSSTGGSVPVATVIKGSELAVKTTMCFTAPPTVQGTEVVMHTSGIIDILSVELYPNMNLYGKRPLFSLPYESPKRSSRGDVMFNLLKDRILDAKESVSLLLGEVVSTVCDIQCGDVTDEQILLTRNSMTHLGTEEQPVISSAGDIITTWRLEDFALFSQFGVEDVLKSCGVELPAGARVWSGFSNTPPDGLHSSFSSQGSVSLMYPRTAPSAPSAFSEYFSWMIPLSSQVVAGDSPLDQRMKKFYEDFSDITAALDTSLVSSRKCCLKYAIPPVQIVTSPFDVKIFSPPNAVQGVPFQILVRITNKLRSVERLLLKVGLHESILLSGFTSSSTEVSPGQTASFSFGVVALECGNVLLPHILVQWMSALALSKQAGGNSEYRSVVDIGNASTSRSLFVFPK